MILKIEASDPAAQVELARLREVISDGFLCYAKHIERLDKELALKSDKRKKKISK